LLVLKIVKGGQEPGISLAFRSWKKQGNIFSLETSERYAALMTPGF
jgi:hypothetical protein